MSCAGGKDEHLPRVGVGYRLGCQVPVVNEADEMAHASARMGGGLRVAKE